jgi:hypothetical protein
MADINIHRVTDVKVEVREQSTYTVIELTIIGEDWQKHTTNDSVVLFSRDETLPFDVVVCEKEKELEDAA